MVSSCGEETGQEKQKKNTDHAIFWGEHVQLTKKPSGIVELSEVTKQNETYLVWISRIWMDVVAIGWKSRSVGKLHCDIYNFNAIRIHFDTDYIFGW